MRSTTNYALPYPEAPDHTRTWEHWQGLAEGVDAALLAGRLSKPCVLVAHLAAKVFGPTNNTVIVCDQVTVNKGGFTVSAAGVTIPVKGIYTVVFQAMVAYTAQAGAQSWVKTATGVGLAYGAASVGANANETFRAQATVALNAGDVIKTYVTYAGDTFHVDAPSGAWGTELTLTMVSTN